MNHTRAKWYKSIKPITKLTLLFTMLLTTSVHSAEFSGNASQVTVSQLPANTLFIRVSGPNNFSSQTDKNTIYATNGNYLVDGQYNYEITATVSTQLQINEDDQINNGRESNVPTETPSTVVEFGYFRISNGQVAKFTGEEQE